MLSKSAAPGLPAARTTPFPLISVCEAIAPASP